MCDIYVCNFCLNIVTAKMTEEKRKKLTRRKSPDQDAMDHIVQGRDKPFLEGKFISTYKGKCSSWSQATVTLV